MSEVILTFNAGSANLKLGIHDAHTLARIDRLQVGSLATAMRQLDRNLTVMAVGHRVVHGGRDFTEPVRITQKVMKALQALSPLAPLHQPANLAAIGEAMQRWPNVPHIACFDTAFHHTQLPFETQLPLPASVTRGDIRRYGFHGLSYQFIASQLPRRSGRVIVAHLGGGASMCAMKDGRSIATTMGFSTLDGLMMGTRSGALDPGIVLYLLQQRGMTAGDIERLLYHDSGLRGVSGISGDMATLEHSRKPEARAAIELFCHLAARQLGGLLTALGGMDMLIFTGGIGEHSAETRALICTHLHWLGLRLSAAANARNAPLISTRGSEIQVRVMPADEESVIAKACRSRLNGK